jgi:glycosyltransferase involved in cell wall biosynthesis
MRIVQFITQSRGGPVDHATDVAAALAARGHDSHLVGPPGAYTDRLAATGAQWHPAEVGDKLDLRAAWRATRVLGDLRPDVLHLQDRRAGLVGRLWSRRGTACVYTLHGVPDSLAELVPGNVAVAPRRRRDGLSYLTAERELARFSRSTVVVPCTALATYARQHIGVHADRVAVVPNGVALPAAPARLDRVGPGPATVRPVGELAVWVGVMQPVKRVELLVGAVAEVPGLRLRLVGDGPTRAAAETAVAEAGTAYRTEFTGYLADPVAALADADIFVLPSAAEACPIALLQAMAAGLPVVASRVGGIPDIVRDGVDGLLVDPRDRAGLVVALHRLTTDPELRARLGASARRRVAERFTVEHCTRSLLDVYGAAR